jgi:glycosyltransferase involved in cell wall biosynthesis
MRIATLITTYNRPTQLKRLVRQLVAQMEDTDKHYVFFMDDGSEKGYVHEAAQPLFEAGVKYRVRFATHNRGKQGYWRTVTELFGMIKGEQYDYILQLPDDVQVPANFYRRAIRLYDAIASSRKVCLNLYRDHRQAQWGSGPPKPYTFEGTEYERTDWVDMCYIATPTFFEALNYRVMHVARNWAVFPELGSGVGAQISRRLRSMGYSQWRLNQSLVIDHGTQESKMNPNRKFLMKTI